MQRKRKDAIAKMVPVQLRMREVRYEAGETISGWYFIDFGLVSPILSVRWRAEAVISS